MQALKSLKVYAMAQLTEGRVYVSRHIEGRFSIQSVPKEPALSSSGSLDVDHQILLHFD